MKMADDNAGGSKLSADSESNKTDSEGKVLPVSIPSQVAVDGLAESSSVTSTTESKLRDASPSGNQITIAADVNNSYAPSLEALSKEKCKSGVNFNRNQSLEMPSVVVKRSRGRPRKDSQKPPKHHLGQSVASKVFPGRPRFKGRKFQHLLMSHKLQDTTQRTLDIYEDIDSDIKSTSGVPEKAVTAPIISVQDNELKIEKFCAFCNLSECSLLGQGKLNLFRVSEGFDCFQAMDAKAKEKTKLEVSSTDSGNKLKLFFKKQRLYNSGEQMKVHRSKSFQTLAEKSNLLSDLIQELELTGFKNIPDTSKIFESSGELYAHFNCAAWSEGVTKTFEKQLSNVDKAVVTAAFQKCSKCSRYGASVRCCVSDCTKIYHYPCAIVSGAVQNANCFKIICSIHLEDAFSFGVICMACHESGDLSQLLLCTSCASYYHGTCMDPPISPTADVRAGWQCLDCKVCQNCRQPDDSSKMILCSSCDKGYHTFCVKPAISSVPKSGWKCYACRLCGDCGARTPGNGPSSRWHMNFTVCDSCYQQRNKGVACPLCGRAYRQFSQRKGMKHCTICLKYIHEECDKRMRRNSVDYVCPICEGKNLEGRYDGPNVKDTFQTSSRDSFVSCVEEYSPSSNESDDTFEVSTSKLVQRRQSSNEIKRRKKTSRSKFKSLNAEPQLLFNMAALVNSKEYKIDDDDPTEDNKLILVSATDEFVLCQDLCVMCGSFGKGEEGRLLACAQCGQCYHTYCVSVKITSVVLKKGWRCLDCTVCEGCGQPHDEGRLLLCDECDISFHIYCLDPPLLEVPQGNWKCKWCVTCIRCGSKSAGSNCNWQQNYTLCAPCASTTACSLCTQHYVDGDLVVQCTRCERWLHGLCDQIETEDDAEKCAEYGYVCPNCRPPDELPPHLLPPPRTPTPEIEPVPEILPEVPKPKDPEPPPLKPKQQPLQFYVDGVCLTESGMQHIKSLAPDMHHPQKKIPRPRKMKHSASLDAIIDECSSLCPTTTTTTTTVTTEEIKTEPANLEELAMRAYEFEEVKLEPGCKEEDKKKRPRKLQKLGIGGFSVKPRGRISSGKDAPPEQSEGVAANATFEPTSVPTEFCNLDDLCGGPDKPKRKRKPKKKTQLDERFPGYLRDAFFGKDLLLSCKKLAKSSGDNMQDATELGSDLGVGPKPFADISGKHSQLLNELHAFDVKLNAQGDARAGPSLASPKDAAPPNISYKSLIKSEIESIKEEHLSSTSSLNSADLAGLPQIDGKEVEDVFQGVMQNNTLSSSSVKFLCPQTSGAGLKGTTFTTTTSSSQSPNMSALHNLGHQPDSNSSWPDSDSEQSQVQKNILKWESDEHLGLLSTISPVLYANINLPHLKIEFPAWADRVKQIAKIWRGLPPEKRQPYLQRARENRAASRTQRSNSVDSDRSQKEVRVPEHQLDPEKQWKQFQAMRQMQQQQQRAQAVLKTEAEKQMISTLSNVEKPLSVTKHEFKPNVPLEPNANKVLEKRWSTSALDISAAELLLQGSKVKLEVPPSVHPYLQDPVQNQLYQARKPSLSPLPPTSMPTRSHSVDSSTPVTKSSDPYKVSPATPTNILQVKKQIQDSQLVLGSPKDSPITPRPHSSESFFRLSTSPQSQLIASLDSHSQPTPTTTTTAAKVPTAKTQDQVSCSSNFSVKLPMSSSNSSVDQLLIPANLIKELSQYEVREKDKSQAEEQQRLEQFLRGSSPTFSPKVATPDLKQKQLRDLLQDTKKEEGNKGEKLDSSQLSSSNIVSSPDLTKMSDLPKPRTSDVQSSVQVDESIFSEVPASEEPSKADNSETATDFLLGKDTNSKGEGKQMDSESGEASQKKKTTADLVKDLEAQPDEHDVITGGVNFDVLPTDIGELEFNDDELLGLGNDFNILEYADPELDKSFSGVGDKNNILDEHLDLDDKDEALQDDIMKVTEEQKSPAVDSTDSKKSSMLGPEGDKCKEQDDLNLSDSFLDFDKKDLNPSSDFNSKHLDSNQTVVEPAAKEEPKVQRYTPGVEIKNEKTLDKCSLQTLVSSHLQCAAEPIIPPPSYHMVAALKQGLEPSKGLFSSPHFNDLRIPQQQPVSSAPSKPLLLQEQPLLLEELVEQEKREQRRQESSGLISPHADTHTALLSDIDFERLKDDVFSGPPDDTASLLGPNDPTLSPSVGVPSSPNSTYASAPPPYSILWQNQDSPGLVSRPATGFMQSLKAKSPVSAIVNSLGLTSSGLNQKPQVAGGNMVTRPINPNFVTAPPSDDSSQQQLDPEKLKLLSQEGRLLQQQAVIASQQKYFETEVIKFRKLKKALSAKQRQLRKNGSELTETDSAELSRISQEQAALQKQLDQVRKQSRQNTIAIQDLRLKQQKQQQQQQQVRAVHPSMASPQSPLQFAPPSPSGHGRLQQQQQHFQPGYSLQFQVAAKTEVKGWSSPKLTQQGDLSQAIKRDSFNENIISPSFSAASLSDTATLKVPNEDAELNEQKVDAVTTVQSDVVPQSILAASLPSSVSNTLKFTLRQTGMPNLTPPPSAAAGNNTPPAVPSSQLSYSPQTLSDLKPESREREVDSSSIADQKREPKEEEQMERQATNCEATNQGQEEGETKPEMLKYIKQEVIDPEECKVETAVEKNSADQANKNRLHEGSSDEELENIGKNVSEGEQNVLLKQLLQNYPSADVPRKTDTKVGIKKDDSSDLASKMNLPFDVDVQSQSALDPKTKKPTYLDIRRAQLEKEPTPPPGEKPNPSKVVVKRKRPKKRKPTDLQTENAKKQRRKAGEEGYESYVESLMTKLTSLPPLPILEPNIKPNFASIPVFGSGDLNLKVSPLKGQYGSAVLPDHIDTYSYQPFTDEPPPSPTLLPPLSPPYRGFFNQEFPYITKAFEKSDLSLALSPPADLEILPKVSRDAGSPDTVISSSSPESCIFEPPVKWPRLSIFIDKLLPRHSPVIPLMYPVPIRATPKEWANFSQLDEDKDKENIPEKKSNIMMMKTRMGGMGGGGGYSAPLKDSGNVAVTLTLTSAAAEDVVGVLSALADLLRIPIPATYEIVERTATPPSQKLGLYQRRAKNSGEDNSIQSLLNGKTSFCRHCDIVVLSAGIRKKATRLACISKDEQEEDDVIFCSTNCYMQFALTHQSSAILEEKEVGAVVDHIGDGERDLKPSPEDALCLMEVDEKAPIDKVESNDYFPALPPSDVGMLTEKMEICEEEPVSRKWKSIKYKYWSNETESLTKIKKKDENEKFRPFYHTIKPSQMPKDERKCIFCHIVGDGETNGTARLLNVDVDKWVHLNCALWSHEVYETVNGALMNVEQAFRRSRLAACAACQRPGASVRCFRVRCPVAYHFPCARKEQCAFYKDKTVLCPQHVHKGNPENRLDSVAVFRRVYINREEHKQVASMIQDDKYVMRVGSLIFLNIGQLLPTQMQAFHTHNCIYPVGYKVIRMYWSMRRMGRRSQYVCTIADAGGRPEFRIQVKDQDQAVLKDKTAKGVWQKVFYPIEKMRRQAKIIKIFPDFITGDDLFGLTEPAVLRIVESLPGVDSLYDYNFRYGRSPFLELPLAINPTGCARSEPKLRTHVKRSHTLHTSNASTARSSFHSAFAGLCFPDAAASSSSSSSPYVKQFVHSKSSQYRKMKTEWRNNVYLARSRIQGLGLYAARDLEKHTMVIEYIGKLIRNEIAERNEAVYEAQNRGVYMFRLDENRVIDATLCGGLARYINHSCSPNCLTEVVQIDRENKILIITNRKVSRGEELSYDYKFEVEDDQHKIPCLCGAPNCRKWMN